MNAPFATATIGEIVADDYRTAAIFEDFGIDFCCGGRRSFGDACALASAEPDGVIAALRALAPDAAECGDAISWPIDRLIDHIIDVHHAYVREALPRIADQRRGVNPCILRPESSARPAGECARRWRATLSVFPVCIELDQSVDRARLN